MSLDGIVSVEETLADFQPSPAEAGVFGHHDAVIIAINRMKMAPMKAVIRAISESDRIGQSAPVTGKKADLVERLTYIFEALYNARQEGQYRDAKRILEIHYGSRIGAQPRRAQPAMDAAIRSNVQHSYAVGPAYPAYSNMTHGSNGYQRQGAFNAAPQRPQQNFPGQMGSFQESPFYQLKYWLTAPCYCPAPSSKSKEPPSLAFQVPPELAKQGALHGPNSPLQLRLFCTPISACLASLNSRRPAPVEFPMVCDLRVNNINLSVNLRGKKTPAKVLPPNLNKDGRLNFVGVNTVQMLYAGTSDAYVMAVAMCDMYSPDSLAKRVRHSSVKSKQDVLREMKRAADDDDIEVGEVTINLKCPLSYTRLVTPCRSAVCSHIQCFDALSFFSINEQTPAWQCPICIKSINPKTLFLDGYVLDILQRVPEDEELIHIDAEGRWRTPNNKFRSDEVASTGATNGRTNDIHESSSSVTPKQGHGSRPTQVKGENDSQPAWDGTSTPASLPSAGLESLTPSRTRKQIEVLEIGDETPSPPPAPTGTEQNGMPVAIATSIYRTGATAAGSSTTTSAAESVLNQSTDSSMSERRGNATAPKPSRGVIDLTLSDSDDDVPVRPAIASRPAMGSFPTQPVHQPIRRHALETGARPASSTLQPLDRFLLPTNGSRPAAPNSSTVANAPVSVPNRSVASRSASNPPPRAMSSAAIGDARTGQDRSEYRVPHSTTLASPPGLTGASVDVELRNRNEAVNGTSSDATVDEAPTAPAVVDDRLQVQGSADRRHQRSEEVDEDKEEQIVRPHKRARNITAPTTSEEGQAFDADDEFADIDFDDFDLEPEAGLAGPSSYSSAVEPAQATGVQNQNGDSGLAESGQPQDGSGKGALADADEVGATGRLRELSEPLQADERAGLVIGNTTTKAA